MKNYIEIKEIHKDTLISKSIELKKQIDYYINNIQPKFDDIEDWQINEYKEVHKNNIELLHYYINEMLRNESIFNDILQYYNLTTVIFCRKYLIDSTRWDLIKKYTGTDIEKSCNEYAKKLSTEHPIFKVGDVVDFWTGYNNDIRVLSKIIGFGKSSEELKENDQIFMLWDCWWFPIKNDSNRQIKLSTI